MTRRVLVTICLALLVTACASAPPQVEDPSYIESLRLRITKVRNAIEETRGTITKSRGAPWAPELTMRLAELLSEEARYHYRLAFEREQRTTRVLHVPQVRLLKQESIATYTQMIQRFPTSELVPRARFNIGHEHRELGNYDQMRATLSELIKLHPDHPLAQDASLVLGDDAFDRNAFGSARVHYERITKAPEGRLSGLAYYKLAWVWVNAGECKQATTSFEQAIDLSNAWEARQREEAQEDPGVTHQDIDVRREALVDVVYCISRDKKKTSAVKYLQSRAYDRGAYLASLERLARRYQVLGNLAGAQVATRELLAIGPASADRIEDVRILHSAIKGTKDYSAVGDEMRLMALALTRYTSRLELSADARAKLHEEFEVYLRDLATAAQEQLATLKGDEQEARAQQLAVGYRSYVDTFPEAEALTEMLLNLADVQDVLGAHLQAGQARRRAAGLMAEGEPQSEVLYDAVVSFQRALEPDATAQVRSQAELQRRRVSARAGLRQVSARLLAFALAPEKERRVRFAIASSWLEEGELGRAVDLLHAVAWAYPKTEQSDAAIALIMDAYYINNDVDGLIFAGRRFLAKDSPASDDRRVALAKLVEAAEEKKIDELSLASAGEEGGGVEALEEFAELNAGSALGERALVNGFVAARASGDSKKMVTLAESLASQYPKSEQLPGVYTTLAQNAVARFEFDRAGTFLQRAAVFDPKQKAKLLSTSGQMMASLGDTQNARARYLEAVEADQGVLGQDALSRLAVLLESQATTREMVSALTPFASGDNPDVLARLGVGLIATGKVEEGENMLGRAGGVLGGAGDEALLARIQYGNAEVLLASLERYPAPDSLDLVQELIDLIDVVGEEYLGAARQGDPVLATTALARLAWANQRSAAILRGVTLPAELGPEEKTQLQEALTTRADNLDAAAKKVLEACGEQAWVGRVFHPAVRGCLKGEALKEPGLVFDVIKPRQGSQAPEGVEALREQSARAPEAHEPLTALGEATLKAGDPHTARLILGRAVDSGGGARALNLLGLAHFGAGDFSGALSAFAEAAAGGLEAGRQNLSVALRRLGLQEASAEALKRYPEGRPGEALLEGS